MKSPIEKHLCDSDLVLKTIIRKHGFRKIQKINSTDFFALIRLIVYQQLSPKAAEKVWSRLWKLLKGNGQMTVQSFLNFPPEKIYSVGVSRSKVEYMRELATKICDKKFNFKELSGLPNAKAKVYLESIRGIGNWTSDMFLMFKLGRPDVLPMNDYGLRRAIKVAYNLKRMPSERMLKDLQNRWMPFQSAACWQLWQYLDSLKN